MINLFLLFLGNLFPKTVYVIPEGMKLYKEYCSITFWKIFSGGIPSWECSPQFVKIDYFDTVLTSVSTSPPLTVEIIIGVLFILLAGVLGILILEFLYHKLDLYVDIFEKKYNQVQNRKRLQSMNGHP